MKKLIKIWLVGLCFSSLYAGYDYEMIIIGAGIGGLTLAAESGKLGRKVLLIEKNKIGGTFFWYGDCLLNVFLQELTNVHLLHKNFDYTVGIPSFESLKNKVFKTVEKMSAQSFGHLMQNESVSAIMGEARFLDGHTVQVDDEIYTGKHIVIATGNKHRPSALKNIENVKSYNLKTFFDIKETPKSLIIVGGGPLGVEIASIFSLMKTKVTLIMRRKTILPRLDSEISKCYESILKSRGVTILCGYEATEVWYNDDKELVVSCYSGVNKKEVKGDCLYLAEGVVASYDGLDLGQAGVAYTKQGIITNAQFKTTCSSVYAIGDVTGSFPQSCFVVYQARALLYSLGWNPLYESYARVKHFPVAQILFTVPSITSLGMTEQEAFEEYGDIIKVYRHKFDIVEQAHIDLSSSGMAKVICLKDGTFLGFHVIGNHSAEIVDCLDFKGKLTDCFGHSIMQGGTFWTYLDILERLGYEACNDLGLNHSKDTASWLTSFLEFLHIK